MSASKGFCLGSALQTLARLCEAVFTAGGDLAALSSFMDTNDAFYGPDAIMTTWIGNHDIPRAIHFASREIASCREGSNPGNGWNWRPTLELIRAFGILDERRLALMSCSGTGVHIEAEEAHEIARRVREAVLTTLKQGEHIQPDLSIAERPKVWKIRFNTLKHYGATYEWLVQFTTFCLNSKGFTVS